MKLVLSINPGDLEELSLSSAPTVHYVYGDESGQITPSTNRTDLIEFFNHLRDSSFGLSIEEFTLFDGESMWQFLPSNIARFFFNVFTIVDATELLVNKFQPDGLEIELSPDRWAQLWIGSVECVAQHFDLPIQRRYRKFSALLRHFSNPWSSWSFHNFKRFTDRQRFRFRYRRWISSKTTPARLSQGKKLLFATQARFWRPGKVDSSRFEDFQLFPVISELRRRGWDSFSGVDCPYTQDLAKVGQTFLSRIAQGEPDLSWQIFDPGHASSRQTKLARQYFRQQLDKLENSALLVRMSNYKGINLVEMIRPIMSHSFTQLLPENYEMRLSARRILQVEQPDAVLMTFETGPYQRALLVEARRAGVPVVGLMHGHISENNTHYRHNRVNASSDSENGGFTVPDITCVWADRYRKELVQSGSYPESSVKVTGNWQYDYLFSNCDKALIAKPDDFLEVGGLGSVLICTSRQDSANFIRRILEFLKSCDTTRVIVKPHPLEPHDKIEALLASDDFSFAEIYDGSIHHALNMADLVITQPSTVIFEALLLRKPVILIDPLGNKGFESVVASGACVFLQSLNELEPAVTGLLTCRDRQLALLNNLDHFRAEYFYKPGEHASAKVADAVDELIRRGPAPLAD